MSALDNEQTSRHVRVMSVIPLKADIRYREWHVRCVPLADISGAVVDQLAYPTPIEAWAPAKLAFGLFCP